MIQNLIWDLDGTLFDTYPAFISAFQAALGGYGVSIPDEEVDALARVSLPFCAARLAERFCLDAAALTERFLEHYTRLPKADQEPFEGAAAVCRHIVCAGGVNLIVTHRRRKSTEELLSVHGLKNLFSGIAAADDGYPQKPDPGAFLALMQQHGLDALQTAAVGDRDIDILAGKAAGLTTCLFASPAVCPEADFTFSHYQEFMAYLVNGTGERASIKS